MKATNHQACFFLLSLITNHSPQVKSTSEHGRVLSMFPFHLTYGEGNEMGSLDTF